MDDFVEKLKKLHKYEQCKPSFYTAFRLSRLALWGCLVVWLFTRLLTGLLTRLLGYWVTYWVIGYWENGLLNGLLGDLGSWVTGDFPGYLAYFVVK